MADPVGEWHINANGYKGILNINSDGAGNLSGTIDFGTGTTFTLQGVWSEAAQEIVFNLIAKPDQTYTGYLFLTKEPIFAGQGRPEPDPDSRLLSGYYEAIGTGASPGQPRFGWVAKQSI